MKFLLSDFVVGCVGLFFAFLLQLLTIFTLNLQTFSELAFSFTFTFEIFYKSLLFSLIMGFFGSVLPAFRVARKNILEALRVI